MSISNFPPYSVLLNYWLALSSLRRTTRAWLMKKLESFCYHWHWSQDLQNPPYIAWWQSDVSKHLPRNKWAGLGNSKYRKPKLPQIPASFTDSVVVVSAHSIPLLCVFWTSLSKVHSVLSEVSQGPLSTEAPVATYFRGRKTVTKKTSLF